VEGVKYLIIVEIIHSIMVESKIGEITHSLLVIPAWVSFENIQNLQAGIYNRIIIEVLLEFWHYKLSVM
jgi:hypothetical protein